jgi:arginase family enzyme
MDAVEVNPSRDIQYMTAILAGRLLHEGMGYAAKATKAKKAKKGRAALR